MQNTPQCRSKETAWAYTGLMGELVLSQSMIRAAAREPKEPIHDMEVPRVGYCDEDEVGRIRNYDRDESDEVYSARGDVRCGD
jgi:hypothetical protein